MNNRSFTAIEPSRSTSASNYTPVVFVVDDDLSVRESLEGLIRSSGLRAQTFSSASQFLSGPRPACPSCLILDVSLPDLTGLELQKLIAAERPEMPIIFITGHRDVPMTVQAMKEGAVEFLTKPFSSNVLLAAVQSAIDQSTAKLEQAAQRTVLRNRYASLSPRERQVLGLVVRGKLNKQVGGELGISEITVKAHRGKAMHKMQARSLADLVRMADSLGLSGNSLYEGNAGWASSRPDGAS